MDTGIGWDVIPEAEGRRPQLVLEGSEDRANYNETQLRGWMTVIWQRDQIGQG